jgi:hypothetical protein
MPRPRMTEDVEFRTDVNTEGDLIRRARFVRRRRRQGGRNVPGNARYYRRQQAELNAARRQQRGAVAGARNAARRGRAADRTARGAGRAGRNAGNPRVVTPRSATRRGGIRGALARVARSAAGALERRRNRRQQR